MADENQAPGIVELVGKTAATAAGALRNRAELLLVEWQEEKGRLTRIFTWAAVLMFLVVAAALLLITTVLLLTPAEWRPYVAGVFTLLALAGAFVAWKMLRSLTAVEPFSATREELQKDKVWVDSLK